MLKCYTFDLGHDWDNPNIYAKSLKGALQTLAVNTDGSWLESVKLISVSEIDKDQDELSVYRYKTSSGAIEDIIAYDRQDAIIKLADNLSEEELKEIELVQVTDLD